ncbi:MAG: spore coat U domain-containing protein [Candidatus Binataceae bacterium]
MTAAVVGCVKPLAIGFAIALALGAAREPAAAMCMLHATPLDFGVVGARIVPSFAEVATISYRCTTRMPMGIRIMLPHPPSGDARVRTMHNGKHQLEYEVTLDPTGHEPWGDGTGGTKVYSDAHPPINQTVTVRAYAHIFPGQAAPAPGTYSDSIMVISQF